MEKLFLAKICALQFFLTMPLPQINFLINYVGYNIADFFTMRARERMHYHTTSQPVG